MYFFLFLSQTFVVVLVEMFCQVASNANWQHFCGKIRKKKKKKKKKKNLECAVNGKPSQIPKLCAYVANSMMAELKDRWTDSHSHTLTMKKSHVASLVKFCPVEIAWQDWRMYTRAQLFTANNVVS